MKYKHSLLARLAIAYFLALSSVLAPSSAQEITITEARFLENGDFQFALSEVPDSEWTLLRSVDMTQWTPQTEHQVTEDQVVIPSAALPESDLAFFKIEVESVGPPQIDGMVWIEPGTFTMGSPETEEGRQENEGPQTEVTISQGFWMGKYEVTRVEYELLLGYTSNFSKDSDLPHELTWSNAEAYCKVLTEHERAAGRLPARYEYNLPTEAQWEYACRAGSSTRFSYGDDMSHTQLEAYAWFGDVFLNGEEQPVGLKQPNPWGLYDMHGNVWEWCADRYASSHPGGSVTDPTGAAAGSIRVIRGGCWHNFPQKCRSANRTGSDSTSANHLAGFRVALVPVD